MNIYSRIGNERRFTLPRLQLLAAFPTPFLLFLFIFNNITYNIGYFGIVWASVDLLVKTEINNKRMKEAVTQFPLGCATFRFYAIPLRFGLCSKLYWPADEQFSVLYFQDKPGTIHRPRRGRRLGWSGREIRTRACSRVIATVDTWLLSMCLKMQKELRYAANSLRNRVR